MKRIIKLSDIIASERFPLVLADGHPLSGVTRSLVELVRQYTPDHRAVIWPVTELVRAVRAGKVTAPPAGKKFVVWLDDIGPGDLVLLDRDVIDTITRHAPVMANINTDWVIRILADTTPLTASAQALLTGKLTLRSHCRFDMSTAERRLAQTMYPDISFGRSVAESFCGGDVLLHRYDDAAHTYHDGHALVAAAVDVRRAGVHRGLDNDKLRELFRRSNAPGRHGENEFQQALAWATHVPDGASVSLIGDRDETGTNTVFPYIAAADDGNYSHPLRAMPDNAWATLLDVLTDEDAYHIGIAAHLRGAHAAAEAAFTRATSATCEVTVAAASAALQHLNP